MDIRVSVRVALSAKDTAALDPDAIDDVGILRIFEVQEISGFSVSLSHGDSQVCVPVDQVALGDRSRLEFLLSIPSSGSGSMYTTICPEPGAESCSTWSRWSSSPPSQVHLNVRDQRSSQYSD